MANSVRQLKNKKVLSKDAKVGVDHKKNIYNRLAACIF